MIIGLGAEQRDQSMFRLTCFITLSPEQLTTAIKGLHFQQTKLVFEWKLDGHVFRIEPFKNQTRANVEFGYRFTLMVPLMVGFIYLIWLWIFQN